MLCIFRSFAPGNFDRMELYRAEPTIQPFHILAADGMDATMTDIPASTSLHVGTSEDGSIPGVSMLTRTAH
jgi:hypothetical protein